jgi:hypothetical protein
MNILQADPKQEIFTNRYSQLRALQREKWRRSPSERGNKERRLTIDKALTHLLERSVELLLDICALDGIILGRDVEIFPLDIAHSNRFADALFVGVDGRVVNVSVAHLESEEDVMGSVLLVECGADAKGWGGKDVAVVEGEEGVVWVHRVGDRWVS